MMKKKEKKKKETNFNSEFQQQPEKQPQSIFDKAFGDSIICPACGAKSTGKFCSECGATLGSQENQVQRKDKVVKKTKVPQVRR